MKLDVRKILSFGMFAVLGCAPTESTSNPSESTTTNSERGVISGVVRDSNTNEGIENALVVLYCECLTAEMERLTSARGVYSFGDLPAGDYTIYVLAGKANASRVTNLSAGREFRADFSVDPEAGMTVE